MKKIYTRLVLVGVSIALLGIQACKNDIEIFADQADVTLVYGILDVKDQVHSVKINRVFQGEKAVADLAKDRSISEYANLEAKIIELDYVDFDTIKTGNEWPLTAVEITNKDTGYFYYPSQTVYQATAKLDSTKFYAIEIDKLDGSPIVTSKTELIQVVDEILTKPVGLQFAGRGLSLAGNDGPNEELDLEMIVPINAKLVEVYLDFRYHNEYLNGTFGEYDTISFLVGTFVSSEVPTNNQLPVSLEGKLNPYDFYNFVAQNVEVVPTGSNIKQRIPEDRPLNFRFVSGGNELNTYMEVASPSTSILETKPEYTNIVNGVGLFSCRTFDEKWSYMSKLSIDYLVNGELLEGRKFCHSTNNTSPQSCY